MNFTPIVALNTLSIVLIVVISVLLVALVVLYFLGKKAEKKQAEQQELMKQNAQQISMFIIDKKKMKLTEAGLPSVVVESTPKYARRTKLPVVKAKVGPKIMSLIADGKVFDQILPKQEGIATISGIYITNFKRKRGPVPDPATTQKKKGIKGLLQRAKSN